MKTYRIYYINFNYIDEKEFNTIEEAKAYAKWEYKIIEA